MKVVIFMYFSIIFFLLDTVIYCEKKSIRNFFYCIGISHVKDFGAFAYKKKQDESYEH